MNFLVHDFLFEKIDVLNEIHGFLFHVTIFCSLKKEFKEDEIERFSISVGNPLGVAFYLKSLEESYAEHSKQTTFISDRFLITSTSEEQSIMNRIIEMVKEISAKNENVLRIKMMKLFSWEYENYPEIVENLYYSR